MTKHLRLLLLLFLLAWPVAAQTSPGNIQPPTTTTLLSAVTTNTNSSALIIRLYGAVLLDVTITGGTVNVNLKGRIDTTTSYRTLTGSNNADGTAITTITATGSYIFPTAGMEDVEVFTTSISGATVTVKARPIPSVGKAMPSGGGGISGSFTSGQVAVANGTSSLVGDSDFTFLTDTLTVTKEVIGGGSAITSSGPGGALGSNAFTSTTYTPASRLINTTSPVTGGGDLSADRTFACATCAVGPGSATDKAIPRYNGTTGKLIQDSGVTVDDSNNITTPGSFTAGFGGSGAGTIELAQGSAPSLGTTSVKIYAPVGVTSYGFVLPSSSATGFLLGTNSSNINTLSFVAATGTGNIVRAASPTLSGNLILDKTITPAGTTGAATINKISGTVNLAAAATSLVVTNSMVDANSIVQCTVATNDTTMKSVQCVATGGSFTVYPNAAPTAETRVNFTVTN